MLRDDNAKGYGCNGDLTGSAPYYKEILRARNEARSLLFRYGVDARDHEDVIQETFIKAWKYWKPDILPFLPWFFECLKRNAHKYRYPAMFITFHDQTVSSGLYEERTYNPELLFTKYNLEKKRMNDILEAMDILPWHYRQIIILRFFERLRYQHISVILNTKEETLRLWCCRAIQRIKKILAKRDLLN